MVLFEQIKLLAALTVPWKNPQNILQVGRFHKLTKQIYGDMLNKSGDRCVNCE